MHSSWIQQQTLTVTHVPYEMQQLLTGPLPCSGDPLTYPVIAKRGIAES